MSDTLPKITVATADTDDVWQSVERTVWRMQLVVALLDRTLDDNARAEMVMAGLHRAFCEGIEDAAYVCHRVAAAHPRSRMAAIIAEQIDTLLALDKTAHRRGSEH